MKADCLQIRLNTSKLGSTYGGEGMLLAGNIALMGHYISNLRDIQFNLFELLGRGEVLEKGAFAEIDRDTANGMLDEVKRMAENDLAESFVDGDRLGVDFNPATGDAKLPESFKKSYRAYMDGNGGW